MKSLKYSHCNIQGIQIIEPAVYEDERGYFFESYNKKQYSEIGIDLEFVQDNQSKSRKGVLRGIHFQRTQPQGKLVRVLQGTVWDVAVDIRPTSPTFGNWFGIEISDKNKLQFYIPPGFAHGFVTISDFAIFSYKCTDFYNPSDESGILYNDPDLKIEWPLSSKHIELSEKDKTWSPLKQIQLK